MGYLGTFPGDPEIGSSNAWNINEYNPSLGVASEAAFDRARSYFGMRPLQDLSDIAGMRGYDSDWHLFGIQPGAVGVMRDSTIQKDPDGSTLSPEEANEQYGIEGELKFTVPIIEEEAKLKNTR